MPELYMWTADKEEWVIACSAEDALAVYCEHTGLLPNESDTLDCWTQVPNDEIVALQVECEEDHQSGDACLKGCDSQHIIHLRKPAQEWVQERGRGYFASANW